MQKLRVSNAHLRRRLKSAGEVRRLTDGEADSLLSRPKSVHEAIEWTSQDRRFVRMAVPVRNSAGEHLKLTGLINREYPGKSSWTLTWGLKGTGEFTECIRRLDLRAKHVNPDGERWEYQTHKHKWSSAEGNDWAYTPDDIPHEIPGQIVGEDNYREVFEAFAAECGIEVGEGYAWSDPVIDNAEIQDGLWEA